MEIQEREYVYIQSYKHDGSLHRTWAKGYVSKRMNGVLLQ